MGRPRNACCKSTEMGPLTTLVYLLTIEDKDRFERSPDVGPI